MNKKIAYLFLNGDLIGKNCFYTDYIKRIQGDIFCADGGYNHCNTLGLVPSEVWGDFDSISSDKLEILKTSGAFLKKFPKDKDFTDGELIIEYLSHIYEKIIIFCGLGGKFSHSLTNITLLNKFPMCHFITPYEEIFMVKKEHYFENLKDHTVSFIPLSQQVTNLSLSGFKYKLNNYTLNQGESLCTSNIVSHKLAKVSFDCGELLAVLEL